MKTGKEFERLIEQWLNILKNKESGYFIKSTTPFRSVPSGETFKIIYSAKALCDFVGIYKGIFILIEAKFISLKSFPFSRLKEHQLEQLKTIKKLGGFSYIFFHILKKEQTVAITINQYFEILDTTKRKSVHIDEILDKGYLIPKSGDLENLFRHSIKFDNFF